MYPSWVAFPLTPVFCGVCQCASHAQKDFFFFFAFSPMVREPFQIFLFIFFFIYLYILHCFNICWRKSQFRASQFLSDSETFDLLCCGMNYTVTGRLESRESWWRLFCFWYSWCLRPVRWGRPNGDRRWLLLLSCAAMHTRVHREATPRVRR